MHNATWVCLVALALYGLLGLLETSRLVVLAEPGSVSRCPLLPSPFRVVHLRVSASPPSPYLHISPRGGLALPASPLAVACWRAAAAAAAAPPTCELAARTAPVADRCGPRTTQPLHRPRHGPRTAHRCGRADDAATGWAGNETALPPMWPLVVLLERDLERCRQIGHLCRQIGFYRRRIFLLCHCQTREDEGKFTMAKKR